MINLNNIKKKLSNYVASNLTIEDVLAIVEEEITEISNDLNNHTHNYAGSDSAGGAADSVKNSLILKLNGGSTEGTNLFTFNGSNAKNINITPDSIGAAPVSHGTHLELGTTSSTAYRGDYGNTAYNHSQSAHAPSNAQKNSDITKSEIEAKLTGNITSHTHDGIYAPVSHGTHLTLGIGSTTAYRGDYGNTAYNHSQSAHAPSNAQKNSDITKAEIEAKLTGTITSHNHSGTYAPVSHGTHLELGTTSSTAYRGDYGNTAYNHSQSAHAPSNAQKNSDITKSEIEAKLTGNITTHTHSQYLTQHQSLSGYATENYVNTQITALVDSAPDAMNTLNELSTAIKNHNDEYSAYVDTVSSALAGKAPLSHTSDTTVHITAAERTAWNAKSNLALGTTSTTAYRGDYGNTAYTHSQAAHAPSNAQKNSDITKAEIEAKLTGTITSHNHSGTYAPVSHNHTSLTGITSLTLAANSDDSSIIQITKDSTTSYTDFIMSDDPGSDMWRWRFKAWDSSVSTTTAEFNLMTLKATSTTKGQLSVNGNITADSFTEGGTALSSKYAAASHGTHLTLGTTSSTAAAGNHTHNYAGSSSAGGAATSANKVNTNLVVKLNSGTTEGTNLFTFNGSAAKTINITPSSIGAAASSHGTHLTLGTTSSTAYRGDYGNTAYNHSQSAHAPSNAQKNSDITKAEIEAKLTGAITSHSHTSVNGYTIWVGTQDQYNAISSKSSTTLYFIKE